MRDAPKILHWKICQQFWTILVDNERCSQNITLKDFPTMLNNFGSQWEMLPQQQGRIPWYVEHVKHSPVVSGRKHETTESRWAETNSQNISTTNTRKISATNIKDLNNKYKKISTTNTQKISTTNIKQVKQAKHSPVVSGRWWRAGGPRSSALSGWPPSKGWGLIWLDW